ncbi:MAG: N-6 DNA methylase [Bacteriovoracaceae bacterium]|nr:N-6 DNA methylase [Bacteriovoracaceae bacterium]
MNSLVLININFKKHREIVESVETEGEIHSNWFQLIASEYFNPAGEIQHERRGPKGVIDVKILKNGRCKLAIELKKPNRGELLENAFQQAHRYAFSFNYYKDGEIVYPLGILTDGDEAIIFDSSLDTTLSFNSKEVLNLKKEDDFLKFKKILERVRNGKLGHARLHRAPFKDTRTIGLLDDRLHTDFQNFYHSLLSKIKKPEIAFDYWVQLFLVAVLRDNGIIPNSTLRALEKSLDASGISNELNRILNENFEKIDNKYADAVWEIYGHTTRFCTRLNLLHPDTLGFAYERILKMVSSKQNATSVYTPEDLAVEMIAKVSPQKTDRIIDTASGTGTLLCVASELAWQKFNPKKEMDTLVKFFEENIFAVDRDIYALKCCKAMLLSTYVKILNAEPSELGEKWKLPKLHHIYESDLFDIKINKKISLVVGNPPWGNIDAPGNPVGLTSKVRDLLKSQHKAIYSDDSDISCYVLKHVQEKRVFPYTENFRACYLIKQQVTTNISNKKFRDWAENSKFKLFDHGQVNRFPHSPASKVAEAIYGVKGLSNHHFITKLNSSGVKNEGRPLSEFIISANGFQPSKKDIYIQIARRIPKELKKKWVKKVYPEKNSGQNLIWNLTESEDILFVPRGCPFPDDIELKAGEIQALKKRAQVTKNFPFSWRGCEKIEFYGKDLSTPRIYMPRMPSSKDGRVKAAIDLNGDGVGTSGQSIWLKKESVSLAHFKCILGWINSKFFMSQLDNAGITLRADGYNFDPNEVYKLNVPDSVFTMEMLDIVEKVLINNSVTANDLEKIDSIFELPDEKLHPLDIDEIEKNLNQISLTKKTRAKKAKVS